MGSYSAKCRCAFLDNMYAGVIGLAVANIWTVTQLGVDKADKAPVEQAAATEVYIRGWKVDDIIVAVLAECLPLLTSLHTVDLWNVGLSDVTLVQLANIMARCRALRTLILDANPVPSQCYHLFLQVATLSYSS